MTNLSEAQDLNASVRGSAGNGLALWEIASVVTSCLIAEWIVLSFAGGNKLIMAIPVLLALGFIVFSHRERRETLRDIGFRTDNFFAACRLLLIPTVIVVVAIVATAWFTRHSIFAAPWRNRLLLLPVWALFQQYVLNGFINRRAQLALGPGMKSILLTAAIFSLFHFPNPLLAILTFAGGLVWATVYQRQPNLLALAVSHAVVSLTLALNVSDSLLNNLRVGFKYFG